MRDVLVWAVAAVLFGCKGGGGEADPVGPASTPEGAFRALVAAIQVGDADAAWPLFEPEGTRFTLELLLRRPDDVEAMLGVPRADVAGLDARGLFDRFVAAMHDRYAAGAPSVGRVERTETERARVHFRTDGGADCWWTFVQADGRWRMTIFRGSLDPSPPIGCTGPAPSPR
jgi:hypothetical protein